MIIESIVVNHFQVNNYLVICEKTKQALLIDSGGEVDSVLNKAKKYDAEIKLILHTHGHVDHVAGSIELKKKTGAKVLLHKNDRDLLSYFREHAVMFGFDEDKLPVIDEFIEDGFKLELGELKVKTISTPGHSQGSVCYLIDDALFSGDTLFDHSVGRTDLPGGSFEELKHSIQQKLFMLSDNTTVYPGHGGSTTIGIEKLENPFFGKAGRA